MIRKLSPAALHGSTGFDVIDVREYPEFAGGTIPGAKLVPLATVLAESRRWPKERTYVVVCKSGKRSLQAAEQMQAANFSQVFVLEGGTEAWAAAGFPMHIAENRPWSLERQVRVAAGTMIVVSAILGLSISLWFFAWTLVVGSGLVFAGVTDTCMMGSILGHMPWNRAGQTAGSCTA